jgi:uncharacterized protein (TIGR03067 family)
MKHVMAAAAAILVTAGLAAQTASTASLDGSWKVSTINGGDPSMMAGGAMVLAFKGTTYQQLIDGTLTEEGTVKLDTSKSPSAIDLIIGTGPDAGKVQRGFVEVKGDTLSMSLSMPDADPSRTASLTEGALVVAATRVK